MKVSVIIPTHDRIHLIGHTLDSLHPSLHPNVELEIIVVDDQSFDGGDDFVEAYYPDVRLVRQKRSGAPAARNRGLELATSEFILLLDSDDLIEPGFFLPRLKALAESPTADGAYGPVDHFRGIGAFDESKVVPRHTPYPVEKEVSARSHIIRTLSGWYIPSHAVLWRNSAIKRVGGQNTKLTINQDVDLMLRILISGNGIVGVDSPRALLREHDDNTQGKVNKWKAEHMLNLRREFVRLLKQQGLWDEEMVQALGVFCFNQWRTLRRTAPKVAEGFYRLSKELYPSYVPTGKLSALARIVGSRRASIIHDSFR